MRLAFILLVLLAGCGGSDSSDDNHGYGFHFDVQGASGLRLRYNQRSTVPQDSVQAFEGHYEAVQKCTGITAPPPFVIIVPGEDILPRSGEYHPNPALIVVISLAVFKHEAIHHLLYFSTGNGDRLHASPLFAQCS